MNEQEHFDCLLESFLDGTLTAVEKRQLETMLRTNPELRADFLRELDFSFQLSANLTPLDRELPQKVAAILGRGSQADDLVAAMRRRFDATTSQKRSRIIRWRIFSMAAAAALLMAVGGAWWVSQRSEDRGQKSAFSLQPSAFVTAVTGECRRQGSSCKIGDAILAGVNIKTAKGGVLKFKFAGENTEVVVGEVSSVECRMSGKGEKRLYLSVGQLAATVAKQAPGKTFEVETPHARVMVVGTKFTTRDDGTGTWVRVDEGVVKLHRRSDDLETCITAGCFAVASDGCPLRSYANGTEYVDGPAIFTDDFEHGLGNWRIVRWTGKDAGVWEEVTQNADMHACIVDAPRDGKPNKAAQIGGQIAWQGDLAIELKTPPFSASQFEGGVCQMEVRREQRWLTTTDVITYSVLPRPPLRLIADAGKLVVFDNVVVRKRLRVPTLP